MLEAPHCLRDGKLWWYFDGVQWHVLDGESGAELWAGAMRARLVVARARSQAVFAHDVAMERFGMTRGHLGLWFCQVARVQAWARY